MAGAGALLYLLAHSNDWVSDDRLFVRDDPLVRDLSSLPAIFTTDYWFFFTRASLYRPITVASMALQHAIAGDAAWSYRLVNALLHGSVGWLLFALLTLRLGLGRLPAALGALLFVAHPAISEAVLQVVGRAEIFVALATLGILHLHLADYRLGRWGPRALVPAAIGIFLLGLGSKESAVAIPPLIVAVDLARGRLTRNLPLHAATFAALFAFWFLVRGPVVAGIVDVRATVENPFIGVGFPERLAGCLGVLGRYAALLFFPWHLSFDYSFDAIPAKPGLGDPFVLLGLAGVALSITAFALACRAGRLSPALGIALVWLPLFPVSNLAVRIGTIFAERFLYLPAAGLAVLAALLLARLPPLAPVVAAVVVAFAIRTAARERDWRDEPTLYERTAQGSSSCKAQYHLALIRKMQGRTAEAEAAFRRSLEIQPTYFKALVDLARLLFETGKLAESEAICRQLIDSGSTREEPYIGLGQILQAKGDAREAVRAFDRAVELAPRAADAWYGKGAAHFQLQELSSARAAFEKALEVEPGFPYARLGLANVLGYGERRWSEAANLFLALTNEDPRFAAAWYGLGEAYWNLGRKAQATEAIERAVDLAPGEPSYRRRIEELRAP